MGINRRHLVEIARSRQDDLGRAKRHIKVTATGVKKAIEQARQLLGEGVETG